MAKKELKFQIFENKKEGKRIKGTKTHDTWTDADRELNTLKKANLCIKQVAVNV